MKKDNEKMKKIKMKSKKIKMKSKKIKPNNEKMFSKMDKFIENFTSSEDKMLFAMKLKERIIHLGLELDKKTKGKNKEETRRLVEEFNKKVMEEIKEIKYYVDSYKKFREGNPPNYIG